MGSPSHAEALIKTCSEIVSELAKAHEANESVNLNSLRLTVSKKHKLQGSPRLVDIIAAVPESLRAVLLPKLKAKPIRTASGVGRLIRSTDIRLTRLADRCSCCYEQAPPLSAYRCYWQHLRVSMLNATDPPS
jgi:histone acetyltransferase (RNA polymerase elongator complex component)